MRPEDIRIIEAGEPPADGFNADVRIDAIELVGAESFIHGSLSDGKPLVFRVAGRSGHAIDEVVKVGASAQNVHLFDANGRRIGD